LRMAVSSMSFIPYYTLIRNICSLDQKFHPLFLPNFSMESGIGWLFFESGNSGHGIRIIDYCTGPYFTRTMPEK